MTDRIRKSRWAGLPRLRVSGLALLVGVSVVAANASAYTDTELETQLELLMTWWSGEFDNNEQIVRQSGGGLSAPTYEPHFRAHGHYVPVDLPDIGEHVLYVEEYKNDDPTDLYRIRLMSLTVDKSRNGIRIDLHATRDQQALVGSHSNVDALEDVNWRKFSDGCAIYMSFEGNQFAGGMESKQCRVATDRDREDKDGYFEYRIVVGKDYYWFKDRIRRLEDDSVTWELAAGSDDFFQLDKATWFSCTVNHNVNGDMTATELLTRVKLHDQGGWAPIDYPDGRKLRLVLHNRAFATPVNDRFRILRVHEGNNPVPIAYSYAIVPAERFGINLGWFYTLCGPNGR